MFLPLSMQSSFIHIACTKSWPVICVSVYGVVPRDAFVTEKGMALFACDYSQKEVRILAHMSGDKNLISLFRGDPKCDIYKQMSSIIRKKPIDQVSDKERAQIKQVTLAILYGMVSFSIVYETIDHDTWNTFAYSIDHAY